MADISSLSVFAAIQDSGLRITFDTNIRWRDEELDLRCGDYGQPVLLGEQVLMEIKMPGACLLWLAHILNDSGIYPTSFSKYGTCYKNFIISREGFLSVDSIIQSQITRTSFLICTGVSIILGIGIALISMFKTKYSQSFAVALAVIPAVVQLIIMLVNGNIGEGIAVAEAFRLVRFRSAPGSAREICSIFLVMAAGLATGMDYVAQQGENRNIAIFIDCYDDLCKIYTVKSCPLLQWQCV